MLSFFRWTALVKRWTAPDGRVGLFNLSFVFFETLQCILVCMVWELERKTGSVDAVESKAKVEIQALFVNYDNGDIIR